MSVNPSRLASQVIAIYNAELGAELDPCSSITQKEQRLILDRWKQMHGLLKSSRYDDLLEGFAFYFRFCRRIDFIMGRRPPYKNGRRPFRANLRWLMESRNFNRIIDGSYTHRIGKKNLC